jgi:hypothetical protein
LLLRDEPARLRGRLGRLHGPHPDAAEASAPLEQKIRRIAQVAFEAYRIDPRGVRVLVLEFARSPSTGEANRRTAFAEVLGVITRMFERARARGELRAGLEPALCGAMLFGSVEMSLTGFVMGLLDPRESGCWPRRRSSSPPCSWTAPAPLRRTRDGRRIGPVPG